MTTMIAPNRAISQCDQCGLVDDHPKLHDGGLNTYHHDCVPFKLKQFIVAGAHSEHVNVLAKIIKACEDGTRGAELLALIQSPQIRPADHGDAQMNTSGIDSVRAAVWLDALLPSSGTTTIGSETMTAPIKCRFDSVMTTTDNGASTEWSSSGGYTAGGVSIGSNWAAASGTPATKATNGAVTVTNAPSQTWAGNELWDSSGTPKRCLYAALTGGSKTVNSGDTCTINSGNLSASAHGS